MFLLDLDMLPYTTPKIPQQPLSERVLWYTRRLMNGERGRSQHVLFLSHCPECSLAIHYISWTVSSLTVFFHLGEEWGGTNVFPVVQAPIHLEAYICKNPFSFFKLLLHNFIYCSWFLNCSPQGLFHLFSYQWVSFNLSPTFLSKFLFTFPIFSSTWLK